MQTQKEMIKEAMEAIAGRKPGKNKLVYDKIKKTIVAVSITEQTEQKVTALNISAEDADMFSQKTITITSQYLNKNWEKLITDCILPIELYEWDEGDAYTLKSLGLSPGQKIISAAMVLEEKQISEFPIIIRIHKSSNDGIYNYISPEGNQYNVMAKQLLMGTFENVRIVVADLDKELPSRYKGLLETDLLKDSSVLIIGLGTGGIHVALELTKAGVGTFKLVDPDRLEIGNILRHQAGISFVGRKKVSVAKDLILEKNPNVKIDIYPILAEFENKEVLTTLVNEADLTICATDNRQSKLFINSLCVEAKKPVIFGGAYRRAFGGHVLRVRPGESACFQCFVLAMPDKEVDQEISSEENAVSIAYSDMPVAIEPGLSMDVAPISIMVSKLALQELIKGRESTLHILDKDFEANWYFWINRPEPNTQYSSWPPLSEESLGMTILRWYAVTVEKDPECPTCGNFDKVLRNKYGLESSSDILPINPFSEVNKLG